MVAWLDVKESEGESEKNRKKVEFLERETDDGEERKRLKPTKGSRLSKHSANEWRWHGGLWWPTTVKLVTCSCVRRRKVRDKSLERGNGGWVV